MTACRCRHRGPRTTVGAILRAELPASPASARDARSAIRRALIAWGMDELAGDAELLVSELVANAAEYADGDSIRLALRREAAACGQRGITCEVSDTSPVLPEVRAAGPEAERGRGLAIVAALATASGVGVSPHGKTSWFTLALSDRACRLARPAGPEPEAEVNA